MYVAYKPKRIDNVFRLPCDVKTMRRITMVLVTSGELTTDYVRYYNKNKSTTDS